MWNESRSFLHGEPQQEFREAVAVSDQLVAPEANPVTLHDLVSGFSIETVDRVGAAPATRNTAR